MPPTGAWPSALSFHPGRAGETSEQPALLHGGFALRRGHGDAQRHHHPCPARPFVQFGDRAGEDLGRAHRLRLGDLLRERITSVDELAVQIAGGGLLPAVEPLLQRPVVQGVHVLHRLFARGQRVVPRPREGRRVVVRGLVAQPAAPARRSGRADRQGQRDDHQRIPRSRPHRPCLRRALPPRALRCRSLPCRPLPCHVLPLPCLPNRTGAPSPPARRHVEPISTIHQRPSRSSAVTVSCAEAVVGARPRRS